MRRALRFVCAAALAFCAVGPAQAQDEGAITVSQPSHLRVTAGHSTLLEFAQPIERASVNNDAVADVVVVSPAQLLIHGKQAGSTTLIVWKAGGSELRTIRVEADLEAIAGTIKHVLPGEVIQVESMAGAVVLSGQVGSPSASARAQAIAEAHGDKVVNLLQVRSGAFDELLHILVPGEAITSYQNDKTIILAGKAKHPANVEKAVQAAGTAAERVVNLIDVSDQKQVLLEVRFAEANRSVGRSLGIDYYAQTEDFTKAGFLSGGLQPQTPSTPQFARLDPQDISLSSTVTDLLEFRRGTDIGVVLTALQEKGLIRILAEPNLLTLSGEEASFLAGGEFPIPVVQSAASTGGNAVTIEFKEFGIRLNFKPVVGGDDSIRMFVEPEVSVLDFGPAAVTIGGFQVPALVTRRASTHVHLRSGESLVIGGLISQTDNRTTDQVPMLGSVPVLGQLFRSERFRKEETELLVLVTPRLTTPSQLDLPANFKQPQAISNAVNSQLTAPPYPDAAADAVRGAVRPEPVVLNPPITVAPPPPMPTAPAKTTGAKPAEPAPKVPEADLAPAEPAAPLDMTVPDLFNRNPKATGR